MNQREQARLSVLNSVLEYQVPIAQAAELLGVSQRHARRLLAAYREQGAAALAHGNRGRRPHNAIPPAQAAAVVELATQRYEGANHTHFTELLSEREGIDLSRPTVRRILTKAGIGSPRSRRSPQHRFRRQRMPQAGMLVQLDGSHHAWLEDRGPKFALLLAVEDRGPKFALLLAVDAPAPARTPEAGGRHRHGGQRRLPHRRGHPRLLHAVGWPDPALGHSPGAVQRSPRRLQAQRPPAGDGGGSHPVHPWPAGIGHPADLRPLTSGQGPSGTHGGDLSGPSGHRTAPGGRQDHCRQATAVLRDFLPRFNARFAVQPEHPDAAYRPVAADLCLSETLCFKHTRRVGRDNTVKYHWRVLQLLPDRERPSYAGLRVEVLERPDSELIVQYQGHTVATQEPPPRMGALWAAVSPWSPGPELRRIVSSVGDHHISKSPQRRLAALEPVRIDEARVKTVAEKDVVSKAPATWGRTPTPTQKARWKAIQQARLKGLSLRAIAKELGIARDTVRKYAYAEQPPTKKLSAQERAKLKALRKSATVAN